MGSQSDPRGVADTARELRQVRDGVLPGEAENVDQEIRDGIESVARLVDDAAVGDLGPELKGLAHQIRLLGTQMTGAREDAVDTVAHMLGAEADQLDALLRPTDDESGQSTSVVLTGAGTGAAAAPGAPHLDCTVPDAQRLHAQRPVEPKAKQRPLNQVVSRLPPKLQDLARTLLFNRSCHAVQRHGHHLTREHQLARLQWLLDPAFADPWQVNDDGSITSLRHRDGRPHQVDAACGCYTSPDAVAKPLTAILTAAGRTQQALDTYLDGIADGATLIRLFLHPDTTGITPDDVDTVRGIGTDTAPGLKLWKAARAGAIAGHGAAPAARAHDTVTHGTRPGSLVILAKGNTPHWRLITSYFTDNPTKLDYTEL